MISYLLSSAISSRRATHSQMPCSQRSWTLPWLVTAALLSATSVEITALEGGVTSTGRGWDSSIDHEAPTAEERTAEKAARQKAIAADIKRLNKRLTNQPSVADTKALHERFKAIKQQRGWSEETGMVFGIRDMNAILDDRSALHPNLLASFVQFRDDMAKRDIDVIFIPFPPTPHVYGHELVDGITADQEYAPGWTKMILEMLEADLEIIEPLEAWRAASKEKLVIKWPNDFHTADGGRMIAADMLAERLQRYQFARDLSKNVPAYSFETQTTTSAKTRIGVVNKQYAPGTPELNFKELTAKHPFEFIQVKANRKK